MIKMLILIIQAAQCLVCLSKCVFVVDMNLCSLRASSNVRTVITQILVTTWQRILKVPSLYLFKIQRSWTEILGVIQFHQSRCIFL